MQCVTISEVTECGTVRDHFISGGGNYLDYSLFNLIYFILNFKRVV